MDNTDEILGYMNVTPSEVRSPYGARAALWFLLGSCVALTFVEFGTQFASAFAQSWLTALWDDYIWQDFPSQVATLIFAGLMALVALGVLANRHSIAQICGATQTLRAAAALGDNKLAPLANDSALGATEAFMPSLPYEFGALKRPVFGRVVWELMGGLASAGWPSCYSVVWHLVRHSLGAHPPGPASSPLAYCFWYCARGGCASRSMQPNSAGI